jgi:hypothetical protein
MKCYLCKLDFPDKETLKPHLVSIHNCTDPFFENQNGDFTCGEEGCNNAKFTDFFAMLDHFDTDHWAPVESEVGMGMDYDEDSEFDEDTDFEEDFADFEVLDDHSDMIMAKEIAKFQIAEILAELRAQCPLIYGFIIFWVLKIAAFISNRLKANFMVMVRMLNLDPNHPAVVDCLSCLNIEEFFETTEAPEAPIQRGMAHLDHIKPKEIVLGSTGSLKDRYQYFPIIQTLEALFKSTALLQIIREEPSTVRSSHPLLQKYKDVVRISLHYDKVESIGCYYFSIENVGSHNGLPENIFTLAIVNNRDVKKYGFRTVFEPFFKEMEQLGSDQPGVEVRVNGVTFELKAVLTTLVGENFQEMSLGGGHFCGHCMITEGEFRDDPTFEAAERPNPNKSLHAFNPVADLLEGVVPLTIKHVLKYLIQEQKVFKVADLNRRIEEFQDCETANKPSANFSLRMLNSKSDKHLHKCGSCSALFRYLSDTS